MSPHDYDIALETLRAVVLAALMAYLLVRGRRTRFAILPGARLVMAGFSLIFLATLLDLTDEVQGLEQFVVLGDTWLEALIEKLFGYLFGFVLIFAGFLKLIPAMTVIEQAEHKVHESEAKFRSVFETIPDVVGITRLNDGSVIDLNPAFEELTGIPRDRLLGRSSLEANVWADPADRERMMQEVLQHGMVRNLEARFNTGGGRVRDSLVSARLVTLDGVPHILSIYKDITERKEVLRALQESEEKFRSVFETIPDVVSITRLRDGLIVDLNPAIDELTGVPRESLVGRSSIEIKVWANPADRDRMVQAVLAHGSIRNMEAQMNSGTGDLLDCLVSARLMQLQGEPHILAVFKDITERKAVLRSLQQSEARFRLVFAASPDPLVIARADGSGIIDVNRAFEAETGITREEALGKTSNELNIWADPHQRDVFMDILRQDGVVANFEAKLRTKGGEVRDCLVSAQLLELDGIPCMLLDNRDITRQKQAEAMLLEMDRMKSDFISTAAHELRTPLATMLGYTELLASPESFGGFSQEQRKEFLAEIYDKGEVLSRIIDEMLDISRIESGQSIALDLQPYEPQSLLARIVQQFQVQSPKHAFRMELPGSQPETIACDLHRITQVLENLLSNAVKYSPRGGPVTVRGERVNDAYVVSVTDEGIGMTPEQVARVFDKFYRVDSSNTAVGGLGLGMSIARQIVEVHGGRIWVESEPGVGTTASFSLPLT